MSANGLLTVGFYSLGNHSNDMNYPNSPSSLGDSQPGSINVSPTPSSRTSISDDSSINGCSSDTNVSTKSLSPIQQNTISILINGEAVSRPTLLEAQAVAPTGTSSFIEYCRNLSLPAIDIDEALGGLATFVDWVKKYAHHGPSFLDKELNDILTSLQNTPMEYVASMLAPDGWNDFCASMGMGGLILLLSTLAIKGGKEGKENASELKEELTSIRESLEQKIKSRAEGLSNEMRACMHTIEQQMLDHLSIPERMNAHNLKIAARTLFSGTVIRGKTLFDMSVSTTLVALLGTFDAKAIILLGAAGGLTATFALSASIISLILGICAAVGALRLGLAFYAKTQDELAQSNEDLTRFNDYVEQGIEALQAREEQLAQDLQKEDGLGNSDDLAVKGLIERTQVYLQQLNYEVQDRQEFIKDFNSWNFGFLASTAVYACANISQTALITLPALAGCTVLASPYVLGLLLAANVLSSISMMICSNQFLRMPDKLNEFNEDRFSFMQALNQDIESHNQADITPGKKPPFSVSQLTDSELIIAVRHHLSRDKSMTLEIAAFQHRKALEEAHHILLKEAAKQKTKNYSPDNSYHSYLQPTSQEQKNSLTFLNSGMAAGRAIKAWMLNSGHSETWRGQLKNARSTWNEERNQLTLESLKKAWKDETNQIGQRQFILDTLSAKREYLLSQHDAQKALWITLRSELFKVNAAEIKHLEALNSCIRKLEESNSDDEVGLTAYQVERDLLLAMHEAEKEAYLASEPFELDAAQMTQLQGFDAFISAFEVEDQDFLDSFPKIRAYFMDVCEGKKEMTKDWIDQLKAGGIEDSERTTSDEFAEFCWNLQEEYDGAHRKHFGLVMAGLQIVKEGVANKKASIPAVQQRIVVNGA